MRIAEFENKLRKYLKVPIEYISVNAKTIEASITKTRHNETETKQHKDQIVENECLRDLQPGQQNLQIQA